MIISFSNSLTVALHLPLCMIRYTLNRHFPSCMWRRKRKWTCWQLWRVAGVPRRSSRCPQTLPRRSHTTTCHHISHPNLPHAYFIHLQTVSVNFVQPLSLLIIILCLCLTFISYCMSWKLFGYIFFTLKCINFILYKGKLLHLYHMWVMAFT